MEPFSPAPRRWSRKFGDALRGIVEGIQGQSSFHVHLPMTLAVIVLAAFLRVSAAESCLLALAVAVVLAAELMNSALEEIARAVDARYNDHLRRGLNIASGAVLIISIGAVVVGLIIFVPRILALPLLSRWLGS